MPDHAAVNFKLPQFPFELVIWYDQIADQLSVILLLSFSWIQIQFSVEILYFQFLSTDHSIQNLWYKYNFAKQNNSLKTHAAIATRIPLKSEAPKSLAHSIQI